MSGLVSVIMPSYKSEKFISDSIDSVLRQTYNNWEMIIIDDLSPDNSNEVISKYVNKDRRIRLICLRENCGPAVARNTGIKIAKGRYIAFLDSDDIWLPEKLEKQVGFMDDNGLPISYGSYYTINRDGKRIGIRRVCPCISYVDMLKSNHIGNLTGIYDVSKIGKYYMDNVGHEDYTLWLKILRDVGEAKGIEDPLAEYRLLDDSLSSNKIKAICWQWIIYRDIVKMNLGERLYYMFCYVYHGIAKRLKKNLM